MIANRLTVAGSLRKTDATRNRFLKELVRIVFLQFAHHACRQIESSVVHGEQDSRDAEGRIVVLAHLFDRPCELRKPLKGKILALHGNDQSIRRHKSIDRQKRKCRRAVNKYVIIRLAKRVKRAFCTALPLFNVQKIDFRANEGDVGGKYRQILKARRNDRLFRCRRTDQNLINALLDFFFADANTARGVSLGIHVHQKDLFAHFSERGSNVDSGRGLANAAFLVCKRNDCSHRLSPFVLRIHRPSPASKTRFFQDATVTKQQDRAQAG